MGAELVRDGNSLKLAKPQQGEMRRSPKYPLLPHPRLWGLIYQEDPPGSCSKTLPPPCASLKTPSSSSSSKKRKCFKSKESGFHVSYFLFPLSIYLALHGSPSAWSWLLPFYAKVSSYHFIYNFNITKTVIFFENLVRGPPQCWILLIFDFIGRSTHLHYIPDRFRIFIHHQS